MSNVHSYMCEYIRLHNLMFFVHINQEQVPWLDVCSPHHIHCWTSLNIIPFQMLKPKCAKTKEDKTTFKRKALRQFHLPSVVNKVPKAMALISDICTRPSPTNKILSHFQKHCSMWLALDIWTNKEMPNTAHYQGLVSGQFGHQCFINQAKMQDFHIIQIGWSIGRFDACSSPLTKSLLVKPDGFVVSGAITPEQTVIIEKAANLGSPVLHVLTELLSELAFVKYHGGRICGHHLEFIMGVIKYHMERVGFDKELEVWSNAAVDGFCTMNPDITGWVRAQSDRHTHRHNPMPQSGVLSLKDMVRVVLPKQATLLNYHSEPGFKSRMTWLVLRELFCNATQASSGV